MGFEQAAIDLLMAGAVASLISIVLFFVLGAVISAKTVADARRQTRRRSPYVGQMSRGCSVGELAEIDLALDRILAEDRTAHSRFTG
jgi:hypothetical protein